MKATAISGQNYLTRPVVPYPNAVTRRQFFNKLLDGLLIGASGVGITVMLAFLLTVC